MNIDQEINKIANTEPHEISEFHLGRLAQLKRLKEDRLKETALVSIQMTRTEAHAFLSGNFSDLANYVENVLVTLREIRRLASGGATYHDPYSKLDGIYHLAKALQEMET